ncbi:hypothetical protein M8J76_001868 [Diaphorina citri]|nr:hypothetical protein M8J76_001868 [Diaphorina citri]
MFTDVNGPLNYLQCCPKFITMLPDVQCTPLSINNVYLRITPTFYWYTYHTSVTCLFTMDSEGNATYEDEYSVQYSEEPEEETEEMMAIRSITEAGFSEAKAEEFHRKRNKPRVQRETVEEAAVRSIPGHGYSHSIGEQQDISQHSSQAQRTAEEMLAIRSITGESFDLEDAEQFIQETVIEQNVEDSEEQRLTEHPVEDDTEETTITATTGEDSTSLGASQSPCSDQSESTNQEAGLGQTVAEHYNQKKNVGTELRKNSRIVYMRNFNNWTKSMLIDEFLTRCKSAQPLGSPIKVLDMGSGKGGDMFKWMNGGVKHVVFADIASVSIEDCKTRYEELKRKEEARPYRRNVRLRSQYEDKALELDLVSCQFCIHYSFESVQQARCMLKNAAECLKPGGFFVGTVPDSNQIMARYRRHQSASFGNDVYQVQCLFDTSRPPPLFGAKYDFNLEGVVNCPEFLVYFPLLERIAGEFGLKRILKENFRSFYLRKIKEHAGLNLLRKMNALETYPPNEGVDTVGQENDYCHAEAYLSEHQGHHKLGTLSKAEWEAIRQENDYCHAEAYLSEHQRHQKVGTLSKAEWEAIRQENDYCHAEAYLSEHQGHQKLGTLSKAEWEAITLYQVFAFEKVKGKVTPDVGKLTPDSGKVTPDLELPTKRPASDDASSSDSAKVARCQDTSISDVTRCSDDR